MEVTYAGIALTGPTVYEQTGPVAFPVSRMVNFPPGVRRDEIYIQPLKNKGRQVQFSCWRSYPNLLDAMAARCDFIASLPESGQLVLVQNSLGSRVTHFGAACILSTPEPLLLGRSVQFTFAFAAKNLTTTRINADFLRDSTGEIVTDENNSPIY